MTNHVLTRILMSASLAAFVLGTAPEPAAADIIPKKLKNLFSSNKDINPEKVRKNQAKQLEKLQKKARKNTREMAALAEYYEQGFGVKRDQSRALKLYQKSFAAGDAMAVYQMGEYYLTGLDVNNDGINEVPRDRAKGLALKKKAIPGIAKLAKKDDGEALYLMGLFHRSGSFGFKKDRKKSRKFFKKGADKKYPKSMYWLGEVLLTEGNKKHREACDKFHESAIMGYGRSAHAIGYCFEQGRGRPRNSGVAKQWYQYGADKRDIQSIIRMGDIYASTNKDTAAEYYDMAVAEGSALGFAGYARSASLLKKTYYYQQALSLNLNNQRYLNEVRSGRPKDDNGRDRIIGIAPGIYTQKDLIYLAAEAARGNQGAVEYAKDFMLMGYIKSLSPVTLLTLENGFSEFGKLLYFSQDNKTLTMSHEFSAHTGTQIIISDWDVATKKLVRMRALEAGLHIQAVSPNGKKLAVVNNTYKYWKNIFDSDVHESLAVLETSTGKQLLTLLKEGEERAYWRARFSEGGKYISVMERRRGDDLIPYRSFVFDLKTGESIHSAYKDQTRIISPNGQHVITRTKAHDKEAATREEAPEVSYQRVPLWHGTTGIEGLEMESSTFSPDQRYWVMPETLFDLKEKKMLGKHDAARAGLGFVTIAGKPLLVRFFRDAVNTYLMQGASIQKVSSAPYDIPRDISYRDIFSPDFTMIATNGVRPDSILKETFIQAYSPPDDETIAKNLEALKTTASADEEIKDVLAMFEAGFGEMAIEKFTEIVSKNPTQIGPSLELLERRTEIDATSIGLALKAAIEVALDAIDIVTVGAFFKDHKGEPGTGKAIIEDFTLFDSALKKAGARIGDRVVSLNGRPYFATNTPEMKTYHDSIAAGQKMKMVIERGDKRITVAYIAQEVPSASGQQAASRLLFWYGLAGNAAGHPDISDMAATKIDQILKRKLYTRYDSILGDTTRQMIVMLRAVAQANRGNMKAAFGLLISEKSMKADKDWGVNHFTWYPDFFTDLHNEPKKLAYILGVKPEGLPKIPEARIKPAPYWTMDGRLIEPGVTAILKQEGGAIID